MAEPARNLPALAPTAEATTFGRQRPLLYADVLPARRLPPPPSSLRLFLKDVASFILVLVPIATFVAALWSAR